MLLFNIGLHTVVGVTFTSFPNYASVVDWCRNKKCAVMRPLKVKNILVMESVNETNKAGYHLASLQRSGPVCAGVQVCISVSRTHSNVLWIFHASPSSAGCSFQRVMPPPVHHIMNPIVSVQWILAKLISLYMIIKNQIHFKTISKKTRSILGWLGKKLIMTWHIIIDAKLSVPSAPEARYSPAAGKRVSQLHYISAETEGDFTCLCCMYRAESQGQDRRS